MKRLPAVLVLAVFFSSIAFADFRQAVKSEGIELNPKQVEYMKARIVQSGSLDVSGNVDSASLTLYVPQDGLESMSVSSGSEGFSWKTAKDEFGNQQVYMEWKRPSGIADYRVETTVESRAKLLPSKKALANDPEYLKENQQIVFTDEMRRIAYPYENSLDKAAELTRWVYNYVDYDLSVAGQLRPSDWVLENRRGVCVEYANLLSSLLKLSGIPNRYVVGYAYSDVENRLIGHTWVEVLADDGTWIPLDPTWLQAGYTDATHIKTANRVDANQTSLLTYFGTGSIDWQKNDDDIRILDYRLGNITRISLETQDISFGEAGFLKASLQSGTCTIADVSTLSCVTEGGRKLLDVLDGKRQLWYCGRADVYWFFSATRQGGDFIYTCPVSVFDQSGAGSAAEIRIKGRKDPGSVSISGPDAVSVNERFTLSASADDFIFYSPNLSRHDEKIWQLSLSKPGTYRFYLYSRGALAEKDVRVTERKEFDVHLSVPKNATIGDPFPVKIIVKNLESIEKQAVLRIEFDGVLEETLAFAPNEAKSLAYNLTARTANGKITASAASDSITSYTASIQIHEKKDAGWLDAMMKFFSGIFSWIASLFGTASSR